MENVRIVWQWIRILPIWIKYWKKKSDRLLQPTFEFSKLKTIKIRENTKWNYSYYPIILKIKHNFSELKIY
jgi:hypothetical protein